ncbi:hypothetical protein MCC00055_11010 [Bifidobacterium longum subsp. longum]|nr:hypothetical protein MCC01976_00440 [Bifidobacteriaceae bacterium MCC01976]GHM61230.1 hypothetical protein MCC00055_11010 [Bifidobacterium longum subsp. longum]GHM77969.1 hypothetical protein MCC00353_03650 [Bifidobacterium longum subsp. longum]
MVTGQNRSISRVCCSRAVAQEAGSGYIAMQVPDCSICAYAIVAPTITDAMEVAKVLGRAPRTHKPMDISNPFHI